MSSTTRWSPRHRGRYTRVSRLERVDLSIVLQTSLSQMSRPIDASCARSPQRYRLGRLMSTLR